MGREGRRKGGISRPQQCGRALLWYFYLVISPTLFELLDLISEVLFFHQQTGKKVM